MWPTWSTSRFLPEFLALPGVSAAPGTTAELALPGALVGLVVLALLGALVGLVVLALLGALAERDDVGVGSSRNKGLAGVAKGNASQILRFRPFPIKPHGKIIGKG